MDRRAVADAIIAVENLVKSLSTVGSVSLRLADMSVGSAHVVMSVNTESAFEVVEYLQGGLRQLEVMAETPARWHRDALRAVVALGEAANRRGVEAVKLGVDTVIERIDGAIRANAETALETQPRSLGGVGVLYRYTNDIARKRRSAGLRDQRTGETVDLLFSSDGITDQGASGGTGGGVGGRGKRCGRATNQGERRRYRTHFHGWANERAKSTRHSRVRLD